MHTNGKHYLLAKKPKLFAFSIRHRILRDSAFCTPEMYVLRFGAAADVQFRQQHIPTRKQKTFQPLKPFKAPPQHVLPALTLNTLKSFPPPPQTHSVYVFHMCLRINIMCLHHTISNVFCVVPDKFFFKKKSYINSSFKESKNSDYSACHLLYLIPFNIK